MSETTTPSPIAGTNWLEQFFLPDGDTTTAQFGRGWLMVVLGQMVSIALGLILLSNRSVVLGSLLLFGGLFVGSWMIGMLHIRRLRDQDRPVWRSFFAYIPMVIAIVVLLVPGPGPGREQDRGESTEPSVVNAEAIDASKTDQAKQQKAGKPDSQTATDSNRDARQAISQNTNKRSGRRGRGARGAPGQRPGEDNKPPNIAMAKATRAVATFSILAFLLSFPSLILIHLAPSNRRPTKNGA